VCLNAIYLGIDSDYNDAANIYNANLVFLIISQFFCIYFTFEVVVRLLAFRNKCDSMKDGWFKFDIFLVVTMILDTWVLMPMLKFVSGGSSAPVPTQPLRMLRLFKLSRMARLMKAFPELVVMIKGLVRSLRAIASSGVLVGLMVYTWAILVHMMLKDDDEFNKKLKEDYDYEFTKILDCMWTLLMAGTLMLDNTAPLMTTLLTHKEIPKVLAGIAFITYSLLSALLILQMLIGVLCDVVSQVGQERRDSDTISLVRQEILSDLLSHDQGDGKISKAEWLSLVEGPKSKVLMKRLNINRMFMTQMASLMYPDEEAEVPIKTVMELMIMCKGDNGATVQIIASALCFLTNELAELHDNMVFHMNLGRGGDSGADMPHHSTSGTFKKSAGADVFS
jgi:hypothetical protein